MLNKVKRFFNKNKHFYLFTYCFIYLIFFKLVEMRTVPYYHNMHHFLDDKIPFNEAFAIPYFLWFFYIGYVLLRLAFKSKYDFIKSFIYIFGGMTIGLVISIGCLIAVTLTKNCFNRLEKYTSTILTISISLSTLFLKQHSVIDVFWGLIMGIVMYFIVYVPDYNRFFNKTKQTE